MPSTFLAPFIFEPILGFVAYHLGKLVVRSHLEVSKYDAQCLGCTLPLLFAMSKPESAPFLQGRQ